MKGNKMITERTLKQWRKEALNPPNFTERGIVVELNESNERTLCNLMFGTINILNQRILRMTQELLDQHLTKER